MPPFRDYQCSRDLPMKDGRDSGGSAGCGHLHGQHNSPQQKHGRTRRAIGGCRSEAEHREMCAEKGGAALPWSGHKQRRLNPDKVSAINKLDPPEKVQEFYFNKPHSVRQLTPLQRGDHVLTRLDNQKAWTTPAVVAGESTTHRSYIIETEQGALYRRNRRHL